MDWGVLQSGKLRLLEMVSHERDGAMACKQPCDTVCLGAMKRLIVVHDQGLLANACMFGNRRPHLMVQAALGSRSYFCIPEKSFKIG